MPPIIVWRVKPRDCLAPVQFASGLQSDGRGFRGLFCLGTRFPWAAYMATGWKPGWPLFQLVTAPRSVWAAVNPNERIPTLFQRDFLQIHQHLPIY